MSFRKTYRDASGLESATSMSHLRTLTNSLWKQDASRCIRILQDALGTLHVEGTLISGGWQNAMRWMEIRYLKMLGVSVFVKVT